MSTFRVGLSSDFLTDAKVKADGKLDLKFSSFDLAPLETAAHIDLTVVQVSFTNNFLVDMQMTATVLQVVDGRIPSENVKDVDALILLGANFDKVHALCSTDLLHLDCAVI
jgi:hypothetical protein